MGTNTIKRIDEIQNNTTSDISLNPTGDLKLDHLSDAGSVKIDSSQVIFTAKDNIIGSAPLVTADSASGYSLGSFWFDNIGNDLYLLKDDSVGAAVWDVILTDPLIGLSIQDPTRLDVKKDTKANLVTYAASATEGQLCFATDTNETFVIFNSALNDLGGAGSGGGGGLDVYFSDNFEGFNLGSLSEGNNATFLGGGSIAGTTSMESTDPIAELESLKYVQASGSLNDYFASAVIDIDIKQAGNSSVATFYYQYDGDDDDMRFYFWDETNSVSLSSSLDLIKTKTNPTRFQINVFIPEGVTELRWGYQVLVENIGAELLVDDIEFSTDPAIFQNLNETGLYRAHTQTGFGSTNTKIPYYTTEVSNTMLGLGVIENDSTNGLSFTATKKCTVNGLLVHVNTATTSAGWSLNSAQLTTNIDSITAADRLSIEVINDAASGTRPDSCPVSIDMEVDDVLRPHTNGAGTTANALSIVALTAV